MTLDELNDQMIVLAAIQQRQGAIQKLQAEELDAVRALHVEMRQTVEELHKEVDATRAKTAELQRQLDVDRATRQERMNEWDQRIEKLVSGFGAFLRETRR